jgi:hypothetical protein
MKEGSNKPKQIRGARRRGVVIIPKKNPGTVIIPQKVTVTIPKKHCTATAKIPSKRPKLF